MNCPECRAPTDLNTDAVSKNYSMQKIVETVLELKHRADDKASVLTTAAQRWGRVRNAHRAVHTMAFPEGAHHRSASAPATRARPLQDVGEAPSSDPDSPKAAPAAAPHIRLGMRSKEVAICASPFG